MNETTPGHIPDPGFDDALDQLIAADNMNRLRLGDAAAELLQIQYMIEDLPPSEQQTAISERNHALLKRMKENVGNDIASLLPLKDTHVAWLRWNGNTWLTCDSDAEGAFRVYRSAAIIDADGSS